MSVIFSGEDVWINALY